MASGRGSATVWLLCCCGVVSLTGGAGVVLGAGLVARHRAEAAADLSALAGAALVLDGRAGDACDQAARVARAQGSRLLSCRVSAASVTVVAATTVPDGLLRLPPARARARAGAAPEAAGSGPG
jgi:secretion/DNA translocation related TadE-like protein